MSFTLEKTEPKFSLLDFGASCKNQRANVGAIASAFPETSDFGCLKLYLWNP